MDSLELDTFSRISDLSEFPYFKEAYHYPLQSEGISTSADEILILSDFRSVLDLITPGNDDDEEDEYEVLNIAEYTSYVDKVVGRPEKGYFAFKFDNDDDVSVATSGAVGFMRKSRRMNDLPSTKVEGFFSGMTGSVQWNFLDYSKVLQLDLEYEIDGIPYVRTDESLYSIFSGGLSFNAISFPVTDEVDSLTWSFSSVSFNELENGEFYGLIYRSDYLEKEDLEGIIPATEDPDSLWNRYYVVRFSSPADSDRDHIPNILDQTGSVSTFPWYTDIETYNNWYFSHWLGLWVYSDRLSDWDYWQYFGWTFVAEAGSREDFWFHAPGISSGWLVSANNSYPTVYDTSNEEFLYLVIVDEALGYVYSYKTDTWKPVNP